MLRRHTTVATGPRWAAAGALLFSTTGASLAFLDASKSAFSSRPTAPLLRYHHCSTASSSSSSSSRRCGAASYSCGGGNATPSASRPSRGFHNGHAVSHSSRSNDNSYSASEKNQIELTDEELRQLRNFMRDEHSQTALPETKSLCNGNAEEDRFVAQRRNHSDSAADSKPTPATLKASQKPVKGKIAQFVESAACIVFGAAMIYGCLAWCIAVPICIWLSLWFGIWVAQEIYADAAYGIPRMWNSLSESPAPSVVLEAAK